MCSKCADEKDYMAQHEEDDDDSWKEFLDEAEEEEEEALAEDIAYEIWELRDDAPSFEELEKMNLDHQSYIDEYCKHG